jgi:hypothetical protein
MKFDKSIPFFNVLLKAPVGTRHGILNSFPQFVIDDLVEILYNIVLGNIDLGSRKKNLKKYKKPLLDILNTKSKLGRRRIVYRQKGGFIGSLIPIVLSVLANTLL